MTLELNKMPVTQQQKGVSCRNGRPVFYNRKGVENQELQRLLYKNAPKRPFPKGTPLILDVVFTYGNKNPKFWGKHKPTRPDLDNLMKGLQDYMTKYRYFTDDNQIVVLCARKFYGNKNTIEIDLKEL
jgi:Holliday junction resolvase RusA-like endonuclease